MAFSFVSQFFFKLIACRTHEFAHGRPNFSDDRIDLITVTVDKTKSELLLSFKEILQSQGSVEFGVLFVKQLLSFSNFVPPVSEFFKDHAFGSYEEN